MTDGMTPDAYSTVYDNIDLDGDGMTGYVERLLGCNPLVPDKPLAPIRRTSLPSFISGVVSRPLQLYINLDPYMRLTLFVYLQEANAVVQKVNGSWIAQWDTTTIANGFHNLSSEF